jgi:hypothetical protein
MGHERRERIHGQFQSRKAARSTAKMDMGHLVAATRHIESQEHDKNGVSPEISSALANINPELLRVFMVNAHRNEWDALT